MTVRGLVRLLQILGGKVAAEFRKEVEEIFTRYTAGDMSMVEEVMANAGSAAPLNAVFRNALASEPVQLSMPDGPASLPEQDIVLARRALWAGVWPGRDGLWATLDE